MGKKKKSKNESGEYEQIDDLHTSQSIFVRLRTSLIHRQDGNNADQMTSQIAMNPIDMRRLNIRDNDPILLLLPRRSSVSDRECSFAAVCHAISASRFSSGKNKQRDSPSKPALALREGEVSLFPLSFQECFLRQLDTQKQTDQAALDLSNDPLKTPTKINSSTASTPLSCPSSTRSSSTTPTVGFSFLEARKANAMARTDSAKKSSLLLPSPLLTSTVDSPSMPKQIIVSPLKTCITARNILGKICKPAQQVVLQLAVPSDRQISKDQSQEVGAPAAAALINPAQNNTSFLDINSLSSGQTQMLRTLTLAQVCGDAAFSSCRYLQPNHSRDLVISFQGLTRYLRVVSCSSTCTDAASNAVGIVHGLDAHFKSLSLEGDHSEQEKRQKQDDADSSPEATKNITPLQWMEEYLGQFNAKVSEREELIRNIPRPPLLLLCVNPDTNISFCPAATASSSSADFASADQGFNNEETLSTKEQPTDKQLVTPQVVGLDSVVRELQTILLPPLVYPQLFQPRIQTINALEKTKCSNIMRAPRGVLLFGPSGGKTRLTLCLSDLSTS